MQRKREVNKEKKKVIESKKQGGEQGKEGKKEVKKEKEGRNNERTRWGSKGRIRKDRGIEHKTEVCKEKMR